MGAHNLAENETSQQTFGIANLKVHSLYHGETKNRTYPERQPPHIHDIAVITLDGEAELNDKVKVAKMSSFTEWNTVTDANLTVIGWGLTWHKGARSEVLKEVDVSVKSIRECEEIFEVRKPSDSYICTKPEYGKDSCQVSKAVLKGNFKRPRAFKARPLLSLTFLHLLHLLHLHLHHFNDFSK